MKNIILLFSLVGAYGTPSFGEGVEDCRTIKSPEAWEACVNSALQESRKYLQVFETLRTHQVPESILDDIEMLQSLPEGKWPLRRYFSDDALDALLAARTRQRDALKSAGARLAAVYHGLENQSLISIHPVMKVLLNHQGDWGGEDTFSDLLSLLSHKDLATLNPEHYPLRLIHPLSLEIVPPTIDPRMNKDERSAAVIHHLRSLLDERKRLGLKGEIGPALSNYKKARDIDNPGWDGMERETATPIKLAFLDSGIDYKAQREFASFMPVMKSEGFRSYDYADDDGDPWAPFDSVLFHGTGVVDSAVRMLRRLSPETLGYTTIAVWKIFSMKIFLSGAQYGKVKRASDPSQRLDNGFWESRPHSYATALFEETSRLGHEKILLNVSLGGRLKVYGFGDEDQVKGIRDSQWLWVMAAGNGRANLEEGDASCLLDFPKAMRPSSKILCVGVTEDDGKHVQKSSNFGPFVDLYTNQSFSPICSGMTSCGTPGVLAYAAKIASEHPEWTSEQIRQQVLLDAEERVLVDRTGKEFTARFLNLKKSRS